MARKVIPSRKQRMEEASRIQALPATPKVTGRGLRPDSKFNDLLVSKFINCMMFEGRKTSAKRVFYDAMDLVAQRTSANALEVFTAAVNNVKPMIEVKSKRDRRPAPLCLAVRRALEGYHGDHAVMSFDPRVAHWFRRHSPRTLRGLVVTEENARTFGGRLFRHWALWHASPDFLAYDVRDFPSGFAAAQRRRGFPLLTWTVRSPQLREVASEYADAPIAEGAGVANIRP